MVITHWSGQSAHVNTGGGTAPRTCGSGSIRPWGNPHLALLARDLARGSTPGALPPAPGPVRARSGRGQRVRAALDRHVPAGAAPDGAQLPCERVGGPAH